MRTRLMILIALTVLAAGVRAAEPPAAVEVSIVGLDEPVSGHLRLLADARFLLQDGEDFVEIPGRRIAAVNGSAELPPVVMDAGRIIFSSFYERVLPDGDVEVWSRTDVRNTGSAMLTSTDWGAADHELEMIRAQEIYDGYGNRLPLRIEREGENRHRITVDFAVPVAPGEILGLAIKTVRRGAARLQNGQWRYRFNVDFSEDRVFLRKVELPAGANLVSSYAGCRVLDHAGKLLLVSQRFYPALTEDPLVITYTLP